MERKLSTILALDVVGFSKLMATDEDMTLAVLKQRRELIDLIIVEHGGSGSSTAAPMAKKLFKLIIDRHALRETIKENKYWDI